MKKYILIALIGLFATSCSEDLMDEINKDNSNPPSGNVSAKFQITDAITSTAFYTLGGNYAWSVSSYTEQIFGCGDNQLMRIELRNRSQTMANSTFDNEWNSTYGNMMNIKQAIDKCAEGGLNSNQKDILGMAQTLMALNLGVLTDLHGDVPYSEAIQGAGKLDPMLDKQSDIYEKNILVLLDDAIVNLTEAITLKQKNAGVQDILFANNNSKWLGMANALKARYLLHTYGRNKAVLPSVVKACEAAIATEFDGAELSIFNGIDCDNSWAAYFWSRYYCGSSTTVSDLLTARNDERLAIYSSNFFGNNAVASPGNEADSRSTRYLNAPAWLNNGASTIHMMSKSELYFILAESQARLGQDATAAYMKGVSTSFSDYAKSGNREYSEDFVKNYFDNNKALYDANPLKEILVQKYISQSRDEQIETYNDIRRCQYADGEYPVKLTNPLNIQNGANNWPYSLPYGASDVTSNPNVTKAYGDGTYVFSKKPWLFGGEN